MNSRLSPLGGITGGISIKVDIMVPACCECYPEGSIADLFFPEAPVFDEICGQDVGRALRVCNHARQREENE